MHRFLALTTLAVLMVLPAHAQTASDGLPSPVTQAEISAMIADPDFHTLPLNLGETGVLTQHFIIGKQSTDQTGKSSSGKAETTYDLAYKETAGGYAVTKTLTKFNLLSFESPDAPPGSPQAKLAGQMQNLISGVSDFSYTTDESLRPVRLDDWPGLKTKLTKMMGDIFEHIGAPPEARNQIDQIIGTMFGSLTPETAATSLMQEEALLSIPHNVGLVLNKPLTSMGQVQVPFGGAMLDARETLELTVWNQNGNMAHVTYDYLPTEAALTAFVAALPDMMKQMGAPASAIADFKTQMKVASAETALKISTHCDFDIAIDTGLISKGACTKTSSFHIADQGVEKVEQYDFSESRKD